MRIDLEAGAIDLDLGRVTDERGDVCERLSNREAALVRYLYDRRGQDVPRDELLERVLGYSPMSLTRALDTAMVRLRKKIEPEPTSPQYLLTAHGCGYRWAGPSGPPAREPRRSFVLRFGDREVDLDRLLVVRNDGVEARLTATEGRLLRVLAQHDGWVAPEDLGSARLERRAMARHLKHTVYRLRKKIEPDPARPRMLVCARERGYRLTQINWNPQPLELPRFVWSAVQHAGTALGLDDCVLYLRRAAKLIQVAAHGPKSPRDGVLLSPVELRVGEGIVGSAAAEGIAQCVPDTREDSRYILDVFAGRSELAVPIVHRERVIGVLDSESERPNAYGADMRVALASLASLVAAGLDDAGWTAGRPASPALEVAAAAREEA